MTTDAHECAFVSNRVYAHVCRHILPNRDKNIFVRLASMQRAPRSGTDEEYSLSLCSVQMWRHLWATDGHSEGTFFYYYIFPL